MKGDPPNRYGWEDWSWDQSVFAGAAQYYRRGRNPYAPALTQALVSALGLDGHGRLLDVGCGPGSVTLLFAPVFDQVVGLDADPGMIREARLAAEEAGVVNARWVGMRAEDLPGQLGTFRVVVFAQSFHWLDRPTVAAAVRRMLEPGGAAVHVDTLAEPAPELLKSAPHPLVPQADITRLGVRWLGPDRRAGRGFRNTSPTGEDDVFQAAGFAPEEIVTIPDDRLLERRIDDVVASVLSTSWTAPHLFDDRLADFEDELRDLLTSVSPDGLFSVPLSDNRLRIHRPL